MITKIVLDADGVLADFAGTAIAATVGKRKIKQVFRDWPAGEYEISKVLGMPRKLFWDKTDNYEFWRSIPLYPGAREFVVTMLKLGNKYKTQVILATQLFHDPKAAEAKLQGLATLGLPTYLIYGGNKSPLDDGTTLLVDDADINHATWKGPSIVVPQVWNCRHAEADRRMLSSPHYFNLITEVQERLTRGY